MTRALRSGRTTGSCATAAAMAGVICMVGGERPTEVAVPLPPGGTLSVPIERYEPEGDSVRVTVIKDGGDDPDVTHGHDIQAVVSIHPSSAPSLDITLDGGVGVGRVTLPGLPVPVGEAAINPEPRKQIAHGVRQAAAEFTGTISVRIEVPAGEAIARKTMNPRLGIIGGISILGTQGIVKPYSHDSWKATIAEGLDVLRAQSIDTAIFTTGRRSERLYLETYPDTPELALVQAADFFKFSMKAAAERDISNVCWSLFFGKLVKQAQGLEYTHAKTHPVDFSKLAGWCKEAGCSQGFLPEIRTANTARQVLELLQSDPARPALIQLLIDKATMHARTFSNGLCNVRYAVFDFDGTRLG